VVILTTDRRHPCRLPPGAAGSAADLERNLLIYASLDNAVALIIWRHHGVITWPPLPSFDNTVATRYLLYGLPLTIQNVAIRVISPSDRYLRKIREQTDSVASYILGWQLASSGITIPITLAMTVIFPRAIPWQGIRIQRAHPVYHQGNRAKPGSDPRLGLIGSAVATPVAHSVSFNYLYRVRSYTGRII
jgi:hypothetical protein